MSENGTHLNGLEEMDREDARFISWYERKAEELKAAWLETVDPELYSEYHEFVRGEFDRGAEDDGHGDAKFDAWYSATSVDLQREWLSRMDPELYDPFWAYVDDEYNLA